MALVLSCVLALSGCGGSSHTSTVTHQKFVSELNALCNRANAAYSAAPSTQAQTGVVAHYLGLFHSLTPPPNQRALYSHYLSALGSELSALRHGNSGAVVSLAQNVAKPLASRLGASDCANPR
jgi:hypothetical protein